VDTHPEVELGLAQPFADGGDLDEQIEDGAGGSGRGEFAGPLGEFGQSCFRGWEFVGHIRLRITPEQRPGPRGDRPDLAQDDLGNTVPAAVPGRSQR
jgi:hypothetical protein